MGKHPQDRFRRLAIVSPTGSKPQQRPAAGLRWWGPKRADMQQATHQKEQFQSLRMAVMPTLSRGMWIEAMAWIKDFVCSYLRGGPARRPGAVVLSFRSDAGRAKSFRRMMADEEFVSKKANGSVGWNSDCEVAPREGGRG
jgi:hypothetical protein